MEGGNADKTVWEREKSNTLRALILDRARRPTDNAVLVLYWLLHTRDQTAWRSLSTDERAQLLNADNEYPRARDILVRYGLLPAHSTALPYVPLPDLDELVVFIACTQWKESPTRVTNREIEERGSDYGDDFVTPAKLLRDLIKDTLAFALLRGIYGNAFTQTIKDKLLRILGSSGEGFTKLSESVEAGFAISRDASKGEWQYGADVTVTTMFMDAFIDDSKDNDSIKGAKLDLIREFLRTELYDFPPYFRYLVRTCIHGENKMQECFLEDSLMG